MSDTREEQVATEAARKFAPWLLWFGVLGGAAAWTVHLVLGWGVVELTCTSGHDEVWGIPLRWFAALLTLLPGLVVLAALAVTWRLHRHDLADVQDAGRKIRRAAFMAEVGLWINGLALLMVVFGGVAVASISPCSR
jgi:hypothetical protein